jgi:hypothetical protein
MSDLLRRSNRRRDAAPAAGGQRSHPATRAAELQRRIRGLTALLAKGEPYHVELDAIANALGVLSMDLESYDPTCHAYRSPRSAPAHPAGRTEHTIRRETAESVFRGLK